MAIVVNVGPTPWLGDPWLGTDPELALVLLRFPDDVAWLRRMWERAELPMEPPSPPHGRGVHDWVTTDLIY